MDLSYARKKLLNYYYSSWCCYYCCYPLDYCCCCYSSWSCCCYPLDYCCYCCYSIIGVIVVIHWNCCYCCSSWCCCYSEYGIIRGRRIISYWIISISIITVASSWLPGSAPPGPWDRDQFISIPAGRLSSLITTIVISCISALWCYYSRFGISRLLFKMITQHFLPGFHYYFCPDY